MKRTTRNDAGRGRGWRAAAVAATVGCASVAHADSITDYIRLETQAGFNHYSIQPDGTWWQEGAQHSIGRNAFAFAAGVGVSVYRTPGWGVMAHIAYVNLGHLTSECMCTAADVDYNTVLHAVNAQRLSSNSGFYGSGGAQGIKLSIEPYTMYRGWHIGVEAGLFPYRPDWTDTAYNVTGAITYRTSHAVQWGKVVALNVERGNFGVSFQHYVLPSRFDAGNSPAMATGANVVMVTYAF